jgi:Heparinase II/III-like protein/Heparinase II/III N-terminus
MTGWLTKVRTALALGLPNIARAAGYRIGVQLGLNPVRRLQGVVPIGPFFDASRMDALPVPAVEDWQSSARIFSRWPMSLGDAPPDWLANPLTGQRISAPQRPWWQIPDFDPAVGDIKLIWELSRMDWVLALAQRVRQNEVGALDRLNVWVADWCEHNPPYLGPNWKCGQEASLRVMNLACAALLLGQVREVLPGLRDLITLHLQRIAPTVQYAMAQDNNHGTSEAAALFMGGSWLSLQGDAQGARWAATGRRLLENRANRLIGAQGTFSQYSLNYHRLMIDTLSMAESWRVHLGLPAFSEKLRGRVLAATQWLHAMVDPKTGDGPNVGANDGARLLQLTNTNYRDYRPSVQLAMVLFAGQRAYANGDWDQASVWLGVALPDGVHPPPGNLQADDGGFMVMRRGAAMTLLRYPRFRFRPSQADALHLDFWLQGKACLRDAGSYSYNTAPHWLAYFGGVSGHNTVQFDGREQMPRLSRFLLGDWLRTEEIQPLVANSDSVQGGAGYCDSHGARHHREVQLKDGSMQVRDQIRGFKNCAVLRWRLAPGEWFLGERVETVVQNRRCIRNQNGHSLTITSDVEITRCELVQGWESLHYLEKTSVPVLELEIARAGTLTTEYLWKT